MIYKILNELPIKMNTDFTGGSKRNDFIKSVFLNHFIGCVAKSVE